MPKLTKEQVEYIRANAGKLSQAVMAKACKVTPSSVNHVLRGRSHVQKTKESE
jgi:predicted XRE-type DNA-binding protein